MTGGPNILCEWNKWKYSVESTGLPSLVSDVDSVAAGLASSGAQKHKRADSATLPTDLPYLVSDAECALGALASAGAQKRDGSLSIG